MQHSELLERWLMEGAYNKVLAARDSMPDPSLCILHAASAEHRAVRARLCMHTQALCLLWMM